PTESQDEFDQLAAELNDEYTPATPTEHALLDQLTAASWKLRRVRTAEAAFYQKMGSQLDPLASFDDPTLERLARHEARFERSFHRALKELQRIQRERRKLQAALEKEQNKPIRTELSRALDEALARSRANRRSRGSYIPTRSLFGSDDDDENDDSSGSID